MIILTMLALFSGCSKKTINSTTESVTNDVNNLVDKATQVRE